MKTKYLVPQTEAYNVACCSTLCASEDGGENAPMVLSFGTVSPETGIDID